MEIKGKVIEVLELQQFENSTKQDFIIETPGEHPKKVCLTDWNSKAKANTLNVGDTVTAHINIESREYNGRWYTDVKVWKMDIEFCKGGDESKDLPF